MTVVNPNLHLEIVVASHHILVRARTGLGRYMCSLMSRRLIETVPVMKRGRMVNEAKRVYASANMERNEFRYHVNNLEEFLTICRYNGVMDSGFTVTHLPIADPDLVEYDIRPTWQDLPHQPPLIDYLVNSPHPRRFLSLQTGQGKSYCAMKAASILGYRMAFMVLPRYIEKWILDIKKTYFIEDLDIFVVSGTKTLRKLLIARASGKTIPKILIFSIPTLRIWYDLYETIGLSAFLELYPIAPWNLFEALGIGLRITDEQHEHFHACSKVDYYTHCKYSIGLSATLFNDRPFVEKMYRLMYPVHTRCKEIPLRKYIVACAVMFQFEHPEDIETTHTQDGFFSNDAVEKSISNNPNTLENYLNYISHVVKLSREERRNQDGTEQQWKIGVYAYRVELIAKIVDRLQSDHPDKKVKMYVSESDYDNLMTSDIYVSTFGSSGTAVDIPGLTDTFMTIALKSKHSNVQIIGRLRELKDGRIPKFWYSVASNLEKPMKYHMEKAALLDERLLSWYTINTGFLV